MTANTFTILQRLGHYKMRPANNLNLLMDSSRGAIAGEGAAFFLLSGKQGEKNYAKIEGIDTIYKPDPARITSDISAFIQRNGKRKEDIDIVLLGLNGDPANDRIYSEVRNELFKETPQAWFKHLSGEYQTVSSFGLWLAAKILKNGTVPEPVLLEGSKPGNIRNILIYNHYRNLDHSLMLVSAL